jgi:hypothetical protein
MSKKTKKTEWSRNCPKCNKVLSYSTEYNCNFANANNSLCRSCGISGRIVSTETRKKISRSKMGVPLSTDSIKKRTKSRYGYKHSDETKKKMRDSTLGRVLSDEHKQKISQAHLGKKLTDDSIKKRTKSRHGYKHSDKTREKMRKSAIKRIELNSGQISPNYNPSSIPIIEEKARELGITDLQHAENGGEFYIKELGYWVDGYSKEKNIVIEYDEPHHNSQIEKDKIREKEIIEHLNCKFIRISEK